ncbi:hypothetical protein A3860_33755 [Niastella vici]|uniref:Uncharacterized protein n=1 Tax=Niastella vici TaxID=1703345 RepID=A0A1V9FPY0_9BACT|nr:hypothetical protein [Niastella vici]OQP60347.1 hypothetical protein A3860_33755 [Niastella vici]
MSTKSTDPHLERALNNAGYSNNGNNTYSDKSGNTIYTDGQYYREPGKSWKQHTIGTPIKKK